MSPLLAIAAIWVAGLVAGKLVQRLHLPSITGYLLVGVVLGPAGFGVVNEYMLTHDLGQFLQIALLLIAFAIGEKLDLHSLGSTARRLALVAVGETLGAFLLTGAGTLAVILRQHPGAASWALGEYVCLAGLLGAIAMATAPASTLAVVREVGGRGPLTRAILPLVAVDNALAIATFGVIMAITQGVVAGVAPGIGIWFGPLLRVGGAVALGLVTGIALDIFARNLERRSELLIAGLGSLLLCGEVARAQGMSPLLTGMAAGFIIVNRDRRDVRVFRAINQFEPPIYLLFFALAGAHLDVRALEAMGMLGAVYVLTRVAGKLLGSWVVAAATGLGERAGRYLGVLLIPQAGVALGLAFLLEQSDLDVYSQLLVPVVLASVVVAELIGPALARQTLVRAGEAHRHPPERAEE